MNDIFNDFRVAKVLIVSAIEEKYDDWEDHGPAPGKDGYRIWINKSTGEQRIQIERPGTPSVKEILDDNGGVIREESTEYTIPPSEKLNGILQSLPETITYDIAKNFVKRSTRENHVYLSKQKLKEILNRGNYSIISAGRNGADYSPEAKYDHKDIAFQRRHEMLVNILDTAGIKYTEGIGSYGNVEPAIMILHGDYPIPDDVLKVLMVHRPQDKTGAIKAFISRLGQRFNQDSIIHVDESKKPPEENKGPENSYEYTSGPKKGKICGDDGWTDMTDASDYYTEIPHTLDGVEKTKFQLNVSPCFEGDGIFKNASLKLRRYRK